MDQQNPSPFPAYEKTSSSSRRVVVIIVLVLLLVGAGAAGVYYLNAKQAAPKTTVMAPTPTAEPTVIPSPTPEETTPSPSSKVTPKVTGKVTTTPAVAADASRKGVTLSVLNGSGVSGAAKKAADYLIGLGYTVSSTGNADSEDYTKTTIQVKKSQSKLLTTLKTDLAKEYTIGSTSATLSDTAATDAIITIGK